MKKMIATMLVLIAVVVVLAQESPLFKATHVYTNTTPIESITYDTGVAVTSEIANTKYAVKLEEFDNLGTWVDIGQAMYMDPALIYTSNQVLTSVSTNYVVDTFVTQVIIGVDTTVSPYVTNSQWVVASTNAVAITTNHVTRYKLNVEIDDLATKTYVSGISNTVITDAATRDVAATNAAVVNAAARDVVISNAVITDAATRDVAATNAAVVNAAARDVVISNAVITDAAARDLSSTTGALSAISATFSGALSADSLTLLGETITNSSGEVWYNYSDLTSAFNSAYLSVSLTNLYPVDTTNIWVFENGMLKSQSTLP